MAMANFLAAACAVGSIASLAWALCNPGSSAFAPRGWPTGPSFVCGVAIHSVLTHVFLPPVSRIPPVNTLSTEEADGGHTQETFRTMGSAQSQTDEPTESTGLSGRDPATQTEEALELPGLPHGSDPIGHSDRPGNPPSASTSATPRTYHPAQGEALLRTRTASDFLIATLILHACALVSGGLLGLPRLMDGSPDSPTIFAVVLIIAWSFLALSSWCRRWAAGAVRKRHSDAPKLDTVAPPRPLPAW